MGTHTDAEIWLLTELLIELLAYKVKTHTVPLLESGQLSKDESDKINDLLVHIHLSAQMLKDFKCWEVIFRAAPSC